jgi:hypothetical protein
MLTESTNKSLPNTIPEKRGQCGKKFPSLRVIEVKIRFEKTSAADCNKRPFHQATSVRVNGLVFPDVHIAVS